MRKIGIYIIFRNTWISYFCSTTTERMSDLESRPAPVIVMQVTNSLKAAAPEIRLTFWKFLTKEKEGKMVFFGKNYRPRSDRPG